MKKLRFLAMLLTAITVTGLFSCKHRNTDVNTDNTEGGSGTVTVKLATPVVTATAGDKEATLTWADVPNAKTYELVWNGGTAKTVTSPHTETGLTNGTTYTYSLVAKGQTIGTTTYTDSEAVTGSVTPSVAGGGTTTQKLAKPVVSAKIGNGEVTLDWVDIPNANGYELVWNGGTSETVTPPVTKTGLINGTTYTYSLVAKGYTSGTTTYTDSDAATGSVTPKAIYTVMFEINGGTPAQPAQKIEDGGKVTEPSSVTKEGFILDGWYKEPTFTNKWNFATDTVTANLTLYAKWKADSKAMVTVNKSQATIIGADMDTSLGFPDTLICSGVFIKDRTVTLSPYEIGRFEVSYELWKEVYDWAITHDYIFFKDESTGETGGKIGEYTDGLTVKESYTSEYEMHPVTNITWGDAVIWCNAYTEKTMTSGDCVYRVDGNIAKDANSKLPKDAYGWEWPVIKNVECNLSKKGFRLPTEAEWEFAARSGKAGQVNPLTKYSGCDDEAVLNDYAWYKTNSKIDIDGKQYNSTHEIGTKKPNELGIYDMSGNIEEWCFDWFPEGNSLENLGIGEVTDPKGSAKGSCKHGRVARGGNYCNDKAYGMSVIQPLLVCYRTTKKYYRPLSSGGFRVARTK